jgi:hypothetical protein
MTDEEIMELVTELAGIMRALKDADPADKADLPPDKADAHHHLQEKRLAAEARPNSIMYVGACPRAKAYQLGMLALWS